MCTRGDGMPGSYAEALAVVAAGLDCLRAAAASGEVPEAEYGQVLAGLQEAQSKHAAARAAILGRFDAADAHDCDGYQNSSSWLRDRTGMTHAAARGQMGQMRTLRARPRLAAALGEGLLSESWLARIAAWTKPLPADMLDTVDALVISVLEAGGDLDDIYLVITAALESERAQPDPADPDDDGFDDRSLRLDSTTDGAGALRGDLTPEATAALQAIMESLGKKQGREDTRTEPQRHHDALLEACRRLIGAQMLPQRAGSSTRVDVHIPFGELVNLPGAGQLTEAWLRGKAGESGWLLGKDAEVAACDALIVPIVTAAPEWTVIAEMIELVAGALGQHGPRGGAPDEPGRPSGDPIGSPAACPQALLSPDEWRALLYAVGKLAIEFVSGPGAIASLLRTGLAPAPFNTKSVPIDVGFSDRVPEPIRRAVIARDRHCAWPGGCDRPPAGCDVHHLIHKKDGGPTSVAGCGMFCDFHHDVCIHRWGWKVEIEADGTVTAVSPDGQQVLRGGRRQPGDQHPPGGRPPPARAA